MTLFLGHFGPKFAQNNFFLKIDPRQILGYFVPHHCAKHQKNLMIQFRENPKWPYFLGHFGPKFAQKDFFMKIDLYQILGYFVPHHCAKNQKNLMIQSRENPKWPYFWAIFGPNLPKHFFYENWAPSHFRTLCSPSLCKKSEKSNDPISRKVHNGRTDERTN